ncbi:DUF1481 domain-containing protein [Vibrio sp. LaRot3]|uniref:DUF1481 domain-containing protein n=1 Tax=Vibrio sp. LaRot3 TaxID=2998829 RepID=UPI0022CE23AB|nr:DUF1481 domain-containing protein [Vibrio sp. LaRot3]MDA0150394.1 DUF1481 domain-containing protein [Vibrio sp. LaRot3]
MKKFLLPSLITSFLLGCSSSSTDLSLEQLSQYSGGQSMGDATSMYWYTERLTLPIKAADYVTVGDYGWYKSNYRWESGSVRELKREGEQLKDDQGLVPYSIHVRFNQDGEAVYQQFRIDGKVLPLKSAKLEQLIQEAEAVARKTKQQDKAGLELMQGYWDGSTFETCNGRSYSDIEFNQTLPSFVVSRLEGIDNYLTFVGSGRVNRVVVDDLLMLADDDQECIERPQLLED